MCKKEAEKVTFLSNRSTIFVINVFLFVKKQSNDVTVTPEESAEKISSFNVGFFLKMSVYNRRTSALNLNDLVKNIPMSLKAPDQAERDKFEWNQVCFDENICCVRKRSTCLCFSVAKCNESDKQHGVSGQGETRSK